MSIKLCVNCHVSENVQSILVQGRTLVNVLLCPLCQQTLSISEWAFTGYLNELFPEVNSREYSDDQIVWKIRQGTSVHSIYARTMSNIAHFYVPKKSVSLSRDYFCHDTSLFYDTVECIRQHRGGWGLVNGTELYCYQFHKSVYDGTGWVVGFILDGKHLQAHSVDMIND